MHLLIYMYNFFQAYMEKHSVTILDNTFLKRDTSPFKLAPNKGLKLWVWKTQQIR